MPSWRDRWVAPMATMEPAEATAPGAAQVDLAAQRAPNYEVDQRINWFEGSSKLFQARPRGDTWLHAVEMHIGSSFSNNFS